MTRKGGFGDGETGLEVREEGAGPEVRGAKSSMIEVGADDDDVA